MSGSNISVLMLNTTVRPSTGVIAVTRMNVGALLKTLCFGCFVGYVSVRVIVNVFCWADRLLCFSYGFNVQYWQHVLYHQEEPGIRCGKCCSFSCCVIVVHICISVERSNMLTDCGLHSLHCVGVQWQLCIVVVSCIIL